MARKRMTQREKIDAAYKRLQSELTRIDDRTCLEDAEKLVERSKQIRRAVRKLDYMRAVSPNGIPTNTEFRFTRVPGRKDLEEIHIETTNPYVKDKIKEVLGVPDEE